ncbi:hypothetical protein C8F04DRAFT_1297454 [Mycena alexandri]|uniref:Zn(2)-C6 fungal-type domain-containing protein n=1 Tax=Mycena alexandri TaxID=1745969 RepID=A0AAD6T8X2_9AGAR|nr:hypothetical protein C8F04DRAFT_1297454 [Mycena alexandri]
MFAHSPSLPKGSACMDCRRRKIRCDAARPICGPCSRAERFEDCEYEGGEVSGVHKLEESILQVRARIMNLENPGVFPPQASLKTPHSSSRMNMQPGSASSHRSQSRSSSTSAINPQTLTLALDAIAPYAHEIGFFLNQKRFRNACLRMRGDQEDPPVALLNSVCLWAACLSSSGSFASHENNLLSQALTMAPTILSSTHRLKIIYGIQTEVLLCQYFLYKGRLVEAHYHLSVAVSHVVLGGFSSIRSSRGSRSSRSAISIPHDRIEEGEIIIGFWTVYSLDKIWSSVLNFPSNFSAESDNVDTPWPLEMEEYEGNQLPQQLQSYNTVQRFIDDAPSDTDGFSGLAILAKSAILLDRATAVSKQWRANMTPAETTAFLKPFTKLNNRIQKFRDRLPPLSPSASSAKPRIILAHTIAHVAAIQLNRPFIAVNPPCHELCLAACRSIVWIVRTGGLRDIPSINPIIGTVWTMTVQILTQEIMRLRHVPNVAAVVADLMTGRDEIVAVASLFSTDCPFMQFQLEQLGPDPNKRR